MAKPFKIFLWIAGILAGLIAVAAIALPMVINPNNYKGRIVTSVKEQTGRDLEISDIKLSVFPWLGLNVKGVTVSNAKGFGPEPFAQLAEVSVRVRLLPLFHRRVEVGKIRVDGLLLNLTKDKDGHDNWSDLSKEDKTATKAEKHAETGGKPISFTVGGVAIKDAVFSYTDKSTGAAYKVDKLSVDTGPVEPGQPLDVTIAFLVNSAQPAIESDVKVSFTATADMDKQVYGLKDLKVDSTTQGATVPGGSQKASLHGQATYDKARGNVTFSDGVLEAAGLTLNTALQAEGVGGDAPKLTGKISTNTFNPKVLAKSFGVVLPPTADDKALTQASFSSNVGGDAKNAKLDNLTLKLDQTTATGSASIKDFAAPVIQFALKADAFDADRYLAPPAKAKEEKPSAAGAEDFKKTVIPVDALDAVNASGTVALNSLKLKGMTLTDIVVTLNAPKGQPKTEAMTAKLYGGKVVQSTRITPGKHGSKDGPRYDLKVGLDSVNSAPMEKDFIGKTYLSGLGTFNLDVNSTGNTVGDILRALAGATALSFKDGAVEGFNLEENVGKAKALYKGDLAAATAVSGPARTEFKDLKGSGKIKDGVLTTDTLDVKGSWYSLGGDGKVSLVNQTVDYTLYPTVTGDKYKELQGQKIPIKVSGSWFDAHVKVDLGSVVKGRAQQEVQKQVEKQQEKLKSKFGDFLQKQLGPKPAPAPAEAPKQDAPSPGT